jgi:hypothetical protein
MIKFSGAFAPVPPLHFDEVAHSELARFSSSLSSAYNQNAIDRGLDRLIANPHRQTSGKLLAQRLFRDGQKHLRQNLKREFLDDEIETENRSFDPPTKVELAEIQHAVQAICNCLMSLTNRERDVFKARASSTSIVELGIGDRWFRTLLKRAQDKLSLRHDIVDARNVIMNGIHKWRWETIGLLKPLTDCLEITK